MFYIKEHSGRLIQRRGHREGHQVILLVNNCWLVDKCASLIWNSEPHSLQRLKKQRFVNQKWENVNQGMIREGVRHTWVWGWDLPKCPVKPRARMARSRQAERLTQNALCGKWNKGDSSGPPSWEHMNQQQALKKPIGWLFGVFKSQAVAEQEPTQQ